MNDFDCLSNLYDSIMKNNDIDAWSTYVVNILNEHFTKSNNVSGVDVGCGTGIFTKAISDNGFNVVGVDTSVSMLNVASNRNCNVLLGNVTTLKGFKVDFITAINDVINYVKQKDLQKTFNSVNNNLKDGGLFIFDISSEYKFKNIISNNLFAEDLEDVTYLWFNELKKDKVNMYLTYFIKNGETYIRKDEDFCEYIHTDFDVEEKLKNAGFEIIKKQGHLGAKINKRTERINYVCRKK